VAKVARLEALKDNLDQKFYSWGYDDHAGWGVYLKIMASDAPSNPPAAALKTERESERLKWTTRRQH